jgi:hypothetical protein
MLQNLTSTETIEKLLGRKITDEMVTRTNGCKTKIFVPLEIEGIAEPVYFVYAKWSPEIHNIVKHGLLAIGFDYEFEGIPLSMVKNGYQKKILTGILQSVSFKILSDNYQATENLRANHS